MSNLANLKVKSMQLYFQYKDGVIVLENYLEKIKVLDNEIDTLETHVFSCCLYSNLVFEKSSLKQLGL